MSQSSPERAQGNIRFGLDIGGTGIKGAPVDITTGKLNADRLRLATPQPATPKAVANVVAEIVTHFGWTDSIGVAFPAAVKSGTAMTAANVDKSWIGTDIEETLRAATGAPVSAVNDADAAGVAEMTYGAGRGQSGVVIMTTFGTGIGTAVFLHGQLVPNTELGHIELNGREAEKYASEVVREKKHLSWSKWAKRVDEYLKHIEALFWPDLIIVGGGASRNADKFLSKLTLRTPVVPAALQNEAGIVGAAVVATGDVTRPAVRDGRADGSRPGATSGAVVVAPARRTAAKRATTKRATRKAGPRVSAIKAVPVRSVSAQAGTNNAPAVSAAAAPAKKAVAKKAPAKKAVAKKAPAKQVAAKKAPATKAPAKRAAAKKAPAKKTATKRAPAKTIAKATPAKATPAKATPAKTAAKAAKAAPTKARTVRKAARGATARTTKRPYVRRTAPPAS